MSGLVVTRLPGESVRIGDAVVEVLPPLSSGAREVRLRIDAPRAVRIVRCELEGSGAPGPDQELLFPPPPAGAGEARNPTPLRPRAGCAAEGTGVSGGWTETASGVLPVAYTDVLAAWCGTSTGSPWTEDPGSVRVAYWDGADLDGHGWRGADGQEWGDPPTHWMPLPAMPPAGRPA